MLNLPLADADKNGRWWNLLLARFMLGFAVGAKSSTTPVYAAEWSAIPYPNRSSRLTAWPVLLQKSVVLSR